MTHGSDDDRPRTELRILADALEYTRTGLQTREPLPLQVGRHNRVVIVRPPRAQAIAQGARGFPVGSAYPLFATLSVFWSMAEVGTPFTHHEVAVERDAETAFQVFGHCSAASGEAGDKQLSDRRAKVGLALLRSDAALLREAGKEDGWGTREMQAMLRTLGCDPGPVDDIYEELTAAGVAAFQDKYNRGVYHERHGGEPSVELTVDGQWNEATEAALYEAFVQAHGAAIEAERIHATHPTAGCSEYNAMREATGAEDRRLVVIARPQLLPHAEHAPCTIGDAGPCAIVDDAPRRCLWYREHVDEPTDAPVVFADPRWLWLGDDRYLLSALTNIAGEAEVEFEVFDAAERVRGAVDAAGAWLQAPRSAVMKGVVWRGVAQVVWSSGVSAEADGRPPFDGFPVFRVRDPASGAFAFGPWPEVATLRLLVATDSASAKAGRVTYRLHANDGSYEAEAALADAVPISPRHVVVEFADVPLDARVTLSVGVDRRWAWDVLSNVLASSLPDNCSIGDKCTVLGGVVPPPDPDPAELDEDEDAANPSLEGDPSEFEEWGYG